MKAFKSADGKLNYIRNRAYGRNVAFCGENDSVWGTMRPAHVTMQVQNGQILEIGRKGRNFHPVELRNALYSFAEQGFLEVDEDAADAAYLRAVPVATQFDPYRTMDPVTGAIIGTNKYGPEGEIVTGMLKPPYNVSVFLGILDAMLDCIEDAAEEA